MKRFLICFLFACVASCVTQAQVAFTEKIQHIPVEGNGHLVVVQDSSITMRVNGTTRKDKTTSTSHHVSTSQTTTSTTAQNGNHLEQTHEAAQQTPEEETERKATPLQGWRIQVYSGSNSRECKIKAQQAGARVRSLFPELSVYTHFFSPRWICRVGDFVSKETAEAYAEKLQRTHKFSEVRVIKSKIARRK